MYFVFYKITYIRGFTFMLTVVFEKTRMIWIFPTASKRYPVHIIHFILTMLNNEQHTCKRVKIDEDGALKNQQMPQTYLLKNSKYPWKILVVIHIGSTEIMKYTTEAYTIKQEQAFFTVINKQNNGSVKQRHHKKSFDSKYKVHHTIPHLTLHGMVKSLASMNLEILGVIYTPSHHLLKSYIMEHKKDHSWVIKTAEPQ